MSVQLDLPTELAAELTDEAIRLGLTLPEYVVRVLSQARPERPQVSTGVELLRYWQDEGLIGTRQDITDSQQHARQLRQGAERRH